MLNSDEKKYVLLHESGQYFKSQNLYLGTATLTNDIDLAEKMSLEVAEKKYSCMNEKCDWKIFHLVVGLRVGQESIRHIKSERKAALEKELKELERFL